ncbi:DUF721 domain-containing protein [Bacteriovoracaceae bacterium]|nr:DUF721 domain-containing protein [Bacteriovoracaceae bacterium]
MNKKLTPLFQSDDEEFVYGNDLKSQRRRRMKGLYSRNKSSMKFVDLIYQWKKIVSPILAEHTIPLKLKNKTLFILLTHSIFGQELQSKQVKIIKKLEAALPIFRQKIKRFKFIISEQKLGELTKKEKKSKEKNTSSETVQESFNPFDPEVSHWKEFYQKHFKHIEDPELDQMMQNIFLQTKISKKPIQ